LLAAGFAPAFDTRDVNAPEMSAVRDAVLLVLKNHEPFPAMAVDRRWNVIFSNCGVKLLVDEVDRELLKPPVNVYRLSLHPDGLRSRVLNFDAYARHMLMRLRHDAATSGDVELSSLLSEVESYPGMRGRATAEAARGSVILPLRLATRAGELSFFSTIATFGTPLDVTVSELAIESFVPGDESTRRRVRHAFQQPIQT
jgi:hypothetical protein